MPTKHLHWMNGDRLLSQRYGSHHARRLIHLSKTLRQCWLSRFERQRSDVGVDHDPAVLHVLNFTPFYDTREDPVPAEVRRYGMGVINQDRSANQANIILPIRIPKSPTPSFEEDLRVHASICAESNRE
ncbi:uncharacterized protein RCC_09217 [Ramularia collo-cygni]|uniref:Uncharacterized protein n=1 Tax=Ramularia collo-cygni TaxID=112498 RepID=A0A2D3V6A9_9PEZI|nr:uncharacterized protein RCC_09217 [Ramularia collo-cygni]CZT23503.1 uncharacterized protein RCC_09217 [Ramularia collo-cygni]